jgi:hypothetical protein
VQLERGQRAFGFEQVTHPIETSLKNSNVMAAREQLLRHPHHQQIIEAETKAPAAQCAGRH